MLSRLTRDKTHESPLRRPFCWRQQKGTETMNENKQQDNSGASAGVSGYADPRHRRAQNEVERAIHEERGTTGQNVEGIVISPDLYDALDWNHVHSDTPYLGLWGYPFEVDETMTGIRAVAYSDPAEWMAAAGAA